MRITDLVQDLFRTSRHNDVPSTLQFRQIDIDSTARRLGLPAKGCENGKSERPSAESAGLDEIEQGIVAEIEAQGQRDHAFYLEHQKTYIDRAGSLGIESLLIDIGTAARSAAADFSGRIQIGLDQLYLLRKQVIATQAELDTFCAEHRLTRPARNLEPKTLKIGVLLVILTLEMIANGVIFAEGSTGGLIEGFGIALLIAAFNVTIGLVAGLVALRWLAHRRFSIKVLALLGLAAYIAAAVFFNLGVAHFRKATVDFDVTQAATIAYKSFVASPQHIEDMTSWMLFGIGILCSLIALVDGWKMDDPYPGYGLRVRQHREAAELYAEDKEELLNELEEVRTKAENVLEGRFRDISARRGEYEYVVAASQAMHRALVQHFEHLETSANTLLRIYRAENRKCRHTPAPARFEADWTYRRPAVAPETIPDGIRSQIEAAVVRAADEIPKRHEEILAAYERAMSQYRRIDELTAKDLPRA